jgi:hypothetical protein
MKSPFSSRLVIEFLSPLFDIIFDTYDTIHSQISQPVFVPPGHFLSVKSLSFSQDGNVVLKLRAFGQDLPQLNGFAGSCKIILKNWKSG